MAPLVTLRDRSGATRQSEREGTGGVGGPGATYRGGRSLPAPIVDSG
jgi:hypothetical protein